MSCVLLILDTLSVESLEGGSMNPTVQLRKAKLREANRLAQGHPAGQWSSWDSNPAPRLLFVQNSDVVPLLGASLASEGPVVS